MKKRPPLASIPATSAAPWGWAMASALLAALISLIVFAPAAWLAKGFYSMSEERVLLAQSEGSLWRGSAQLLLTGGLGSQDAAALPGRIEWQLQPRLNGAQIDLHMPCCATRVIELFLRPGWQQASMSIAPAKVHLPAQWLSGLGAPFNTMAPEGQLSLSTQALDVQWAAGRMRVLGQANLDLTDMSSRLSTLKPLGDYRLLLSGGDAPRIELSTLQGALRLSGSGQVVGSRLRFTGEASAAPEQEQQLSNLLNIIGRRQGAKSLISLG